MLTADLSMPSAAAIAARISSMYGSSFGRSARTVTSTLPMPKPAPQNDLHRAAKQADAVRVLPLRIVVGKQPADVSHRRRSENRIGEGMTDDVGVGVALEAAFEGDANAGQNQIATGNQPVKIVAGPDSQGGDTMAGVAYACKILGRRDLEIGLVAFDDVHGQPCPFHEHRLVGDVRPVGPGKRPLQHFAAKRLRSLREEEVFTRQRFDDAAVRPAQRGALYGVAHRKRCDGRAVPCGRFGRCRNQCPAHERPRGVVDEDDLGVGRHAREGVGHGILTANSARDDLDASAGSDAIGPLLRHRDDDLTDVRHRQKSVDAQVDHRAAVAEIEKLFWRVDAEPRAFARGHDDRA